jgi:hypothetical protein
MSYRKEAKITGVLYITATVAGFISAILLGSFLEDVDFLTKIAANENQVILAGFFELIMALSVAGIAISMYPVLKKHNNGLALGSVGFRVMEGALFMVGVLFVFSLLVVSKEFVLTGSPSNSYFQTLGLIFADEIPWTLGGIAFTVGASLYYIIFYQTDLVPKWLSIWGFIAVVLAFTSYGLQFFMVDIEAFAMLFHLPMMLQEMVLAIWLIIKGYSE